MLRDNIVTATASNLVIFDWWQPTGGLDRYRCLPPTSQTSPSPPTSEDLTVTDLGDGEPMREQACADAQRLGLPKAVLSTGGHVETFTTIDPVMALVAPFLTN